MRQVIFLLSLFVWHHLVPDCFATSTPVPPPPKPQCAPDEEAEYIDGGWTCCTSIGPKRTCFPRPNRTPECIAGARHTIRFYERETDLCRGTTCKGKPISEPYDKVVRTVLLHQECQYEGLSNENPSWVTRCFTSYTETYSCHPQEKECKVDSPRGSSESKEQIPAIEFDEFKEETNCNEGVA